MKSQQSSKDLLAARWYERAAKQAEENAVDARDNGDLEDHDDQLRQASIYHANARDLRLRAEEQSCEASTFTIHRIEEEEK